MKLLNIIFIFTLAVCIFEARAVVTINGKVFDSSQPIIIKNSSTVKNLRDDLQGVLTNKKNNFINRIKNKKIKK